jgi:hypothetical protein
LVQRVLKEKVPWYKSTYERPIIKVNSAALEIVQVNHFMELETYNESHDKKNSEECHIKKIEKTLELLSRGTNNSEEEKVLGSNERSPKELNESGAKSGLDFFNNIKTNLDTFPKNKQSDLKNSVERENAVKTLTEKREISDGAKVKVQCMKSIPKELGSVTLKKGTVLNCFEENKKYLGYVKNEKLFIINEDKVPEFICNVGKEWNDNFFFKKHFEIIQYIS